MNEIKYEERLVAYIDILGFKKMVLDNNMEKIKCVQAVLEGLAEGNYKKGTHNGSDYGREVTWFSDSLVISYQKETLGESHFAPFILVDDLKYIQSELFRNRILSRGGIALGEMHHMKSEVIGPALIEAYSIESCKELWMPTIKVTTALYNYFLSSTDNTCDGSDMPSSFIKHENLDYYYIGFLSHYLTLADDIDRDSLTGDSLTKEYEGFIQENLESQTGRVRDKYKWLDEHFE